MLRTNLTLLLAILALGIPRFAVAGPPPTSRLDSFEDLRGKVEVSSSGSRVVVTLRDELDRSILRSYIVQTETPLNVPLALQADGGELQVGCGHLVVTLPGRGGDLHFYVPAGGDAGALGVAFAGRAGEGRAASTTFRARAIVSRSGPAAHLPAGAWLGEDDPRVYGPEGVVGISRGSSCSIQCSETTSCSAICRSPRPRCAVCSCPAHCTCR